MTLDGARWTACALFALLALFVVVMNLVWWFHERADGRRASTVPVVVPMFAAFAAVACPNPRARWFALVLLAADLGTLVTVRALIRAWRQ